VPAEHERQPAEHLPLGHRLSGREHRPDPPGQVLVVSHAILQQSELAGQPAGSGGRTAGKVTGQPALISPAMPSWPTNTMMLPNPGGAAVAPRPRPAGPTARTTSRTRHRACRGQQAAARIAAGAAIVTLARRSNAQFVAAGLLAAATAIAAQAEAHLHACRGGSSDLAEVVIPALAVAAILVFLLGLAVGSRPR
jgi:hypothetical protein